MVNELVDSYLKGGTAAKIAAGIEAAVRDGLLRSGDQLPTVRDLAERLSVSPGTVASAFGALKSRGLVVAQGRRGTRVSHRPLAPARYREHVPTDVVNLHDGNPDRSLLISMERVLGRLDPSPRLYGDGPADPDLLRLSHRELRADGVAVGELCVVHGAIDAIGRVLSEHLRPGDRVGVEDPGFTGHLDLVMSRGLALTPIRIDQHGPVPESVEQACAEGIKALIVTPRAQSPTGAALSEDRARVLRGVLRRAPDLLIIEDDHANRISDVPLHCLHDPNRARWVHVHSFSKSLNPDLRMAVMTGDTVTMQHIQDRMFVEERWVSLFLQRAVYAMLADSTIRAHLRTVARTYTRRRTAVMSALSAVGFPTTARSGYNVWLRVPQETATVQALAAAGWGVAAGERFRLESGPAVRITASTLDPADAARFAAAVARALPPIRTGLG